MTTHPEVLWAQRSSATDDAKNIIYLTVNLPDIQEQSLAFELTSSSISFKAKTGDVGRGLPDKVYEFKLDFYAEVTPELSTKKLTTRSFSAVIRKKNKEEEYWPRLTKEKVKNPFLKTDFSKWVDEDEQEGATIPEDDGDDFSGGLGNMGGSMPGGMDFEKMMAQMKESGASGDPTSDEGDDNDSDDDGPPPLEEAPSK
ncbi:Protein wos2 [Termitomyces sp. T112]|nr:hypothetical protein C0989_001127 [Termitomyces sp. Mn162]KAG5715916.1 Protein wos2 [Termitomyces sp. T112]KAH0590217.1 hypothetical protein H2248_000389 [Termitomyces sp. 'cryptogamus']KNZ78165.1 Protein wos2 [Termitomyces sp. J132]